MTSKTVIIKESFVDSLGHLNNAAYLTLFEEARWDHITARGYGFEKIQTTQKGPVILEVQLKFLKEIRLREEITLNLEVLEYQGKIGKLRQTMSKSDGELAAEAIFVFALFDLNLRKIVEPTDDWSFALQTAPRVC